MPLMSLDDVKNKAPDRTAFTAAKKIANPTNWDKLGQEGKILWGIATGSKGDALGRVVGDPEEPDGLGRRCLGEQRAVQRVADDVFIHGSGESRPDWGVSSVRGIDPIASRVHTPASGIREADVVFHVTIGDDAPAFALPACVRVDRGWVLQSIARPGEEKR